MADQPSERPFAGIPAEDAARLYLSKARPLTNPLISWVLTGITGLTLVSVLGAIFAAGIWKGSIDTQLNAIAERQKQTLDDERETRQKLEALQNSLSELKGQMQRTAKAPAQ